MFSKAARWTSEHLSAGLLREGLWRLEGRAKTSPPEINVFYRGSRAALRIQADPWARLSLFQSRDGVAERFKQRHGRAANDGKCREIVAHLSQGRQFFDAARGAGALARPLLLYYGMLSLSRGLVLYSSGRLRETGLSETHGVGTPGWSNKLGASADLSKSVLELPLRVEGGTFGQLLAGPGNSEWTQVEWLDERVLYRLRDTGGGLGGEYGWLAPLSQQIESGSEILFGDILARIPDLANLYEDVFGTVAACCPAEIVVRRGPFNMGPTIGPEDRSVEFTLGLNRRLPPDDRAWLATLGFVFDPAVSFRRDHLGRLRSSSEVESREAVMASMKLVGTNSRGENFVVSPLEGQIRLSSICTYFLCGFALGMLVRYFPTSWNDLASGRKGDRVFPLLTAAVDEIESRFPREIADAFERVCPPNTPFEFTVSVS